MPDAAGAPDAGPVAGAGGESSLAPVAAAGAAGAPTQSCVSDRDCDDQLACNGAETCGADGFCEPGLPACENADPAHCSTTCIEVASGKTECRLAALDVDNDGAGSALCKAQPGTDCDDSNAAVHPGATEICDGLDNDCNGKADLADGLKLGGTTQEIGDSTSTKRSTPRVAWAPGAKMFGFAWRDTKASLTETLHIEGRDASDALLLDGRTIDLGHTATADLAIAGNASSFELAWSSPAGVNSDVLAREVTSKGGFTSMPATLATGVQPEQISVSPTATGWAVAWSGITNEDNGDEYVWARVVNGVSLGNLLTLGAPTAGGVRSWTFRALGSMLLFTDTEFFDAKAAVLTSQAKLLSSSLTTTKTVALTDPQPIGAVGANGFAVATGPEVLNPTAKRALTLFSSSGVKTCGPVEIGGSGTTTEDLVATPRGYLVVHTGSLQEVSSTCEVGPLVPFTTDSLGPSAQVKVAGGDQGYAVVWTSPTGVPKRRIFGAGLCN
ncbi:MAG TPA: putative metal-binding motif-containing protein [Polyangiaceae bacterium]|nr:putative metal-binding motif-containing protein [Polyangiaceae bacterium]